MSRTYSPFRRALALFLACQPVLWMSNVALAQSLQQQGMDVQQADQQRVQQGLEGARGPGAGPSPLGGTQPFGAQQPFGTPPAAGGPSFGGVQPFGIPPQAGVQGAGAEMEGARPDRLQAAPAGLLPPVDEPIDPARYVLGPNDVLELHFWGVENFRLRVPVDLEGRAFVPKVGYLSLQGKTLQQAQAILEKSVARYFPKLGFGVNLAEPRTFLVQVVDAVGKPSSYPARAIDRVATVVMRAGGILPNGSRRRIEVRRRDGTTVLADLLLYSLTGDVKHNPYVLDGDVVRVPYQTLVASIEGAVNRPGRYELVGSSDLAELVELAGGLTPMATTGLPVMVVRRAPEERLQRLAVDFAAGGKLPAMPVQREDAVWIPSFAELQQSITVTGAIAGVAATPTTAGSAPGAAPGTGAAAGPADEAAATRRLPYAKGETVRTLLERVGGVGPLADLKGAYILRGGRAVPVDLYELVMLRDLSADKPVELGDTLVVPFKRPNVLVEGAVFKPGPYPYNPTFGVEQYLALAGGLNRYAQSVDNVYLVTPTGEMKEFAPDLKVEPGASLVVPERNFSRAEVVSLILAGAGVLLSAVTIFVTLRK